ncbi:MAG: hypothetical protein WC546_06515 [Candidatus Omnitrophota bacterium]
MMKLKQFFKNIKKALPKLLFSFLAFFFLISCDNKPAAPTYSRKDIESTIKSLCTKEFNIEVKVWEVGDTIWVYSPFEKIVNSKGELDKDVSDKIRKIFLSLRRVILSMDKRPKFYCFVASDINVGFDLYYAWYVRDLVMFETGYISLGNFQEREAFIHALNTKALGDTQGDHISRYDINLGEFISYLIKQNIEKKFTEEKLKDNFKINDLHVKYYNKRLEIDFDIEVTKYKEGLLYPFDETVAVTKNILKIYDYPEEISEVTINDAFNKKSRLYTRKALIEDN